MTLAVVLAGAVALGSGAYVLGSETGSGSAVAASAAADRQQQDHPRVGPRRGFGPRHARMQLDVLASELGVEPARLREALDALREDRRVRGQVADGVVRALARALSIPEAQAREGLEGLRSKRRAYRREHRGERRPDARPRRGVRRAMKVEALAEALGVSEERVRDALPALRTAMKEQLEARRAAFAKALAAKLGLEEAKVADALAGLPFPHHGRRGRP